MGDLLGTLPLSGMSTVGLASLVVWLVARGWFIPRITMRDLLDGRDERIRELRAECDDRKAQGDNLIEALKIRDAQFSELLELAKTGNALIKAVAETRGVRK